MGCGVWGVGLEVWRLEFGGVRGLQFGFCSLGLGVWGVGHLKYKQPNLPWDGEPARPLGQDGGDQTTLQRQRLRDKTVSDKKNSPGSRIDMGDALGKAVISQQNQD